MNRSVMSGERVAQGKLRLASLRGKKKREGRSGWRLGGWVGGLKKALFQF